MEYRLRDSQQPWCAVSWHQGRWLLPLEVTGLDTVGLEVSVQSPRGNGYQCKANWITAESVSEIEGVGLFGITLRPSLAPGPGDYMTVLRLGGFDLAILMRLRLTDPGPAPPEFFAEPEIASDVQKVAVTRDSHDHSQPVNEVSQEPVVEPELPQPEVFAEPAIATDTLEVAVTSASDDEPETANTDSRGVVAVIKIKPEILPLQAAPNPEPRSSNFGPRFCSQCGASRRERNRFCESCGAPFASSPGPLADDVANDVKVGLSGREAKVKEPSAAIPRSTPAREVLAEPEIAIEVQELTNEVNSELVTDGEPEPGWTHEVVAESETATDAQEVVVASAPDQPEPAGEVSLAPDDQPQPEPALQLEALAESEIAPGAQEVVVASAPVDQPQPGQEAITIIEPEPAPRFVTPGLTGRSAGPVAQTQVDSSVAAPARPRSMSKFAALSLMPASLAFLIGILYARGPGTQPDSSELDRRTANTTQAPTPRPAHASPVLVGNGITWKKQDGRFIVRSVLAGTPASNGDIQVGDVIVWINEDPLEDKTLEQAQTLLQGEAGSEVVVTVAHNGETREVNLTRTNPQPERDTTPAYPASTPKQSPSDLPSPVSPATPRLANAPHAPVHSTSSPKRPPTDSPNSVPSAVTADVPQAAVDSAPDPVPTHRPYTARANSPLVFDEMGITGEKQNGRFTLLTVVSGSPASNGGLQVGDVIVWINGEFVEDKTLEKAQTTLREGVGSEVFVTVAHNGFLREVRLPGVNPQSSTKPPTTDGPAGLAGANPQSDSTPPATGVRARLEVYRTDATPYPADGTVIINCEVKNEGNGSSKGVSGILTLTGPRFTGSVSDNVNISKQVWLSKSISGPSVLPGASWQFSERYRHPSGNAMPIGNIYAEFKLNN